MELLARTLLPEIALPKLKIRLPTKEKIMFNEKQTSQYKKLFLFLFCCFLTSSTLFGQTPTQDIRGTIVDADTKIPLIGASVVLLGTEPLRGATSDIDGQFKITDVPVGRKDIQITYLGYDPVNIQSIQLTSGKELVLNIELLESAISMAEVVVKAKLDKAETLNEMATVSARSFSVEETARYASSFNDPARMAKNYAGVSGGGDDLLNEIVVRGNSPRGVLWRLEGIEIPNPNHFSSMGSTGGGISMLSSSTLANSDFYTGAFPSEFGNAVSGVFDLNLRRGNNEKREYAFMVGLLGLEAALEGPFYKGGKSSYLVNYRYSTLSALGAIGIDVVGDIFPSYQDLSFKVHMPTEKAGVFSLFGLGGNNVASYNPTPDSTRWDDDFGNFGFVEKQTVGTVGLSHRIVLSDRSYLRTVVVGSVDNAEEEYFELNPENDYAKEIEEKGKFINTTYRLSSTYNHKFNAKHTLRTGLIISQMEYDLKSEYFDDEEEVFYTIFDNKGAAQMYQAFAHWKFRLNNSVTFNSGVHYTNFALNGNQSIEPRAAVKWNFAPRQSISASVGLHSKPEHLSFYLVEEKTTGSERTTPNKGMDFIKSMHAVVGYDWQLSDQLRLKAEVYYQRLYDVPVVNDSTNNGSLLNAASIWDVSRATDVVSEGTGYNYGIDLTLEKFFSNNYYFLLTGSLFDSKYSPLSGETFNTRYNSGYQLNLLGGKEFKVGKEKQNIIGLNGKFLLAGGNRQTPIDLEASRLEGSTVRFTDRPFAEQFPAYYRFDLGVSYKINKKKMTHTISLDVQNVTNRLNTFFTYFDGDAGAVKTAYQTGLFPVFNYRIEF